jgi:hypothetical protein
MAWPAPAEVWDDEPWDRLTVRALTLARDAGALTVLPLFLLHRAAVDIHAGEFAAAAVLTAKAEAIVDATRNTRRQSTSLLPAAWRGQEDATLRMADASVRAATLRREGRAIRIGRGLEGGPLQRSGRLGERTRAAGTDWALGCRPVRARPAPLRRTAPPRTAPGGRAPSRRPTG